MRTVLFVNEFTEFSYSCYKGIIYWSVLVSTLTIQASSRLKRSANHLWNNSDICRKKFGEWSPLKNHKSYEMTFVKLETFCIIPISHPGTNFYRLRWSLVLPVLNTPTPRFKDNKQKAMIIIIIPGLIKMSAFDWSMTRWYKTHATGW